MWDLDPLLSPKFNNHLEGLDLQKSTSLTLEEATLAQMKLRRYLDVGVRFSQIAGIAFRRGLEQVEVGVAVVSTSNWKTISTNYVAEVLPVPVQSSEIESFLIGPAALATLNKLAFKPDMLFVDGPGIAHPRQFGIACHLGLVTQTPAIGINAHLPSRCSIGGQISLGQTRASSLKVVSGPSRSEVGALVRTQEDQEGIFVSVGNRLSHADAISFALRASPHHRFPAPLQAAQDVLRENRK
jgi:deoxyribonuclease V